MNSLLHITSGDICGNSLARSGIEGEIFVWHDILYDGPRKPGWPDEEILMARALFIEETTGRGLARELVLRTLRHQYEKLAEAGEYQSIVLWFDACLFDQSMLCHILNCLYLKKVRNVELLCIGSFPGIVPFNGLGQLMPSQFPSIYHQRRPVTDEQFLFAGEADSAFALQDEKALVRMAALTDAPLPWVPPAAKRWLCEKPDTTGLGQLQKLVMEAVRNGDRTPRRIFKTVSAADTHPLFWGDTTLWAKINSLADRNPPLVSIEGPSKRLPKWESSLDLDLFTINLSKT